ncbi:MAG TPA: hypothetical protein PKA30_12190 [Accumulibacter sp.]|uniref:hypothetical protein n=1 Tax=Accumulibacter sp. TaxID=2053492 RepID=UPI002C47B44F|nr:hypothetical protein [Accumulibacter sp.]HMV06298.1 hypothetical protein [Accumulibacter sp.]HMW81374.1 hypothetical protein [Accumulibacter sp.]HMX69313.1 hypothetical protein [Accumulibacter sp.]HND40119.1 hypothetical protein [Accumulibacter sp.]HNE41239.1 hypothetical protein [Accumulibacter sp.]
MSANPFAGPNRIVALLSAVATALMIGAYFAPIWWVSLTAPNYPPDAFPDGIRIHFHFNGVFNGCSAAGKGSRMASEIIQKDISHEDERYNPITDKGKDVNQGAQGLDCVHEMNTINHYVGMFPIATGAPVEKPLAKFFFAFFAVMLIGFMLPQRAARVRLLSAGFLAVAAWMLVDQYALGGLQAHVAHYVSETATFFNEPEKIRGWGENVTRITHLVIGATFVAMLLIVLGVARVRAFTLVLALIPALLPIYFLITYAGWLWFFGHNMHPWGAFTLKPFMPTVFGEGKVAQFSTYSYPYWGYAMLVGVMICLLLALLIRRRQLREGSVE